MMLSCAMVFMHEMKPIVVNANARCHFLRDGNELEHLEKVSSALIIRRIFLPLFTKYSCLDNI